MLDKERKLTKVIIRLLPHMGYKIIQINALPFKENTKGADIVTSDNKGNIIPIELKAYHRNTYLPNTIRKLDKLEDEFSQLQRYIKELNSQYGILITTTNKLRKNMQIHSNIKIINADDLIELIKQNNLSSNLPAISWIRNMHSSKDKREYIGKIKRKVMNFVLKEIENGNKPRVRQIQDKFRIDLRTYFPNGIDEVYNRAKTIH